MSGKCVTGSFDVHIGSMDRPKNLSTKTGVNMLGGSIFRNPSWIYVPNDYHLQCRQEVAMACPGFEPVASSSEVNLNYFFIPMVSVVYTVSWVFDCRE